MRAIALLVAASLGGCSFAFVSGPPADHAKLPYFNCTTSRTVPVLDTLYTASTAASLVLAASESDASWNALFDNSPILSRHAAIVAYSVEGALGLLGAVYGYVQTGRCRRATDELMNRSDDAPDVIGAAGKAPAAN